MSKHATPENSPHRTRTLVAASFGVGVLALTGAGVYAGLQADATGAQTVSSGTLKLVQTAAGTSSGFGQTFSDLAPGDARSIYVDVTDTGTVAGQNLNLSVTGTGATLLTTHVTKGLHVTVQSCAVAWAAGACLAPTTVVSNVPVATLSSTPSSLVSGAVTKNSAYHYKVTTTLPDQNETTTNGTLPVGSIQNLTTDLTFTFNEAQRAATSTDA